MKHIVLIREEYTRDLEDYNRPNEPDTLEAGWEAACGPVYLGIYSGTEEEAIKAAAGDHGVVPQALVATPSMKRKSQMTFSTSAITPWASIWVNWKTTPTILCWTTSWNLTRKKGGRFPP